MLKRIALFGVFFFATAISTAAITNAAQAPKKGSTTLPTPKAPQPKGICIPMGARC
jgi:hypothetical protein